MSDLAEIRQGLADALAPLNEDGSWISIYPYMRAEPNPPCIQVMPSEVQYDVAGSRGGDAVYMTIQAFVVANFDTAAQVQLDRLLAGSGPLSIKTLVEADATLGGKVDDLRVTESTGYQVYMLRPGRPVLGADWTVQVETSTEGD